MEVLFEPAVLVSLIGTLLVAMLSKRLAILGEYVIAHIFLIPRRFRERLRLRRWRSRRKLIEDARGHHRVTLSIAKTYSLLFIFLLVFVFYLLLVILGPLQGIAQLPFSIQTLISAPIYISETLWIIQRGRMLNLVRVAENRVTNRSSTFRPVGLHRMP